MSNTINFLLGPMHLRYSYPPASFKGGNSSNSELYNASAELQSWIDKVFSPNPESSSLVLSSFPGALSDALSAKQINECVQVLGLDLYGAVRPSIQKLANS